MQPPLLACYLSALLAAPGVLAAQTPQTVTWLGPTNAVLVPNVPYPLSASASSGLPVGFRVESGPAVLEGSVLTVTNAGTVTVVAEQAGSAQYAPIMLRRQFNLSEVLCRWLAQWPAYARGPAQAVAIAGGYAYVAAGSGGLIVLDVSNPASPVRVGGYDTSGYASGVAVVGNYAYVADGERACRCST